MGKNKIKISVRDLVEFVLRSGDLVPSFKGTSRNTDAIKIHKKLEKSDVNDYKKEFYLSYIFEIETLNIEISGRADGIITSEEGTTVDEIKTTTMPLNEIDENYNILHWAQAECYAYIYSVQNNLKKISVQLTYYQFETKEIKRIVKKFYLKELDKFFNNLISNFLVYAELINNWTDIRDDSINELNFPFSSFRKGQRKLAVLTYVSIKQSKRLFVEAPTGIGKTIATIFPSIKALYEKHCSKIFYLTPKTTGKLNAEKSFIKMKDLGLKFKVTVITAKEKICFKDKNCDPEVCEYAKGHYDRIKQAVLDIYQNEDMFDKEIIEKYAVKYKVCPFEFSLDLCNYSDAIICDYNYVFDPRVYLKRFFEVKGDYVVLIDEAHNMVDRAREMYSAELNKCDILSLRKSVKTNIPDLYKNLGKINTYFLNQNKKISEKYYVEREYPSDLIPLLRRFITICDRYLDKKEETDFNDELLELYFNVLRYLRTCETYDNKYITYTESDNKNMRIKLFCLDPSSMLEKTLKKIKSTIFFSATLTPMNYYINLLGCNTELPNTKLPSPFLKENLIVFIDDKISTKYKKRNLTINSVISDIVEIVSSMKGNYLVFFPSYEYMNKVYEKLQEVHNDLNVIKQDIDMTEDERSSYLSKFSKENTNALLGFAVMGGVFGEGIDLVGERLVGTIIIGVGMPKICFERNIIKEYFDKKYDKGFEYAYIYPGINKVMQAAGRVIRSENDKGIILLIDDRYTEKEYLSLLPNQWFPINLYKNKLNFNNLINKL